MTLCLGSALPVNLARGGRMRPTERRFYKTGMNGIALLFKQLIKIKKQSGEMVQRGSEFTDASLPTVDCSYILSGIFRLVFNGGLGHYCDHSIDSHAWLQNTQRLIIFIRHFTTKNRQSVSGLTAIIIARLPRKIPLYCMWLTLHIAFPFSRFYGQE